MVSTGRPSDPYEEVITITSKSVDHRSHAYGTCATNGGQPRIRCSIGKKFSQMVKPFGILAVSDIVVLRNSPEITKALTARTPTGCNLEIFM